MVGAVHEDISARSGRGGESLLAEMRDGAGHVTSRCDQEDGRVAQQALRLHRALVGCPRPAFRKDGIRRDAEPNGKLLHLYGLFGSIAENRSITCRHDETIGASVSKEIDAADCANERILVESMAGSQ